MVILLIFYTQGQLYLYPLDGSWCTQDFILTFSVENVIFFKRAIIFTCIHLSLLWANFQGFILASIKLSINSYLEGPGVPLKLLGIGGVIP